MTSSILASIDAHHRSLRVEKAFRELTLQTYYFERDQYYASWLTVLARWVFPVPDAPVNKNEAMGRVSSAIPFLDRWIALATASTASGWPITYRYDVRPDLDQFYVLNIPSLPVSFEDPTGFLYPMPKAAAQEFEWLVRRSPQFWPE